MFFLRRGVANNFTKKFRIGKILRRKGDKSLVKWMGYFYAFNSWVDSKAIVGKI